MVIHLSITKRKCAQGVSAVLDNIETQLVPLGGHKVFRARSMESREAIVEGTPNFRLVSLIKKINVVYVIYMLFSALSIVKNNLASVEKGSIVVCHDIFCLIWVAMLGSPGIERKVCLYNHSDGHPIDTLIDKHDSMLVRFLCNLIEKRLAKLRLNSIYSLSLAATNKIKARFKYSRDMRFVEVRNFAAIAKHRPKISIREPRVWIIGTVCERKGQLELFERLSQLGHVIPDIHVAGPATKEDIKQMGNYSFVKYLGILADVSSEMISKDICLSVSSNEGLPMALIEAASAGAVIISTDVGGCSDICHDNVNGYLLPYPYSDKDLLGRILELKSSDDLVLRFSDSSKDLFESFFSVGCAVRFWKSEILLISSKL